MKCLFSDVHTLGFFSSIQAKDQSKVDMILNTLKVATRIKGVLSIKIKQNIAQLQDNWVSRTSVVQIRVFDRLRPPEGNFHLRMSQYPKTWYNMLKRTPRVHSQVRNLFQRVHSQKSKIRVSQCKIHLLHKGQNWNFCKYQVSWPINQESMVHCHIWTRIDQEIKITCKRRKVWKNLEKFLSYWKSGKNGQVHHFERS